MAFLDFHPISPISTLFHTFLLISTTSTLFSEGVLGARRACFLAISEPYPYGIPQKAAVMRGDVANLPVLLRKPGQLSNPRFVAWPLELGLGTHNPCSTYLHMYGLHLHRRTMMMRMLWVMMGMYVPFVAPSLTLKRRPCVTSVATNALFMAFPVVHDVCYVTGR